ncbi:MAG: hypothetical protein WD056_00200 [Gemmatimonadota bacterium]
MTQTTMSALREIQTIDERVREIRKEIEAFDDRLAEVEEPALALEKELSQLQDRLTQMRADARRLERSADDKRARADKMDLRLQKVSNLREEAAVRTELDLLRRAIEADEQEALQLIDQVRRLEETEEELLERAGAARAEVEPRQDALLADRQSWQARFDEFASRRAAALESVAELERRVYDAFHQSGRRIVVAALLEDGACGHCFGVIPLQVQNEVRSGDTMIRCEACGVILTSEPEPELDAALTEPLRSASEVDEAVDAEEAIAAEAEAEEESEGEEDGEAEVELKAARE